MAIYCVPSRLNYENSIRIVAGLLGHSFKLVFGRGHKRKQRSTALGLSHLQKSLHRVTLHPKNFDDGNSNLGVGLACFTSAAGPLRPAGPRTDELRTLPHRTPTKKMRNSSHLLAPCRIAACRGRCAGFDTAPCHLSSIRGRETCPSI